MQSARGGSKDPRPSASAAGTTAARVLLRFHPTILAAVAVFLINMLILHERPGINYERGIPTGLVNRAGTAFNVRVDVVQGVPGITATCNTKHLRSGEHRTMQSGLIPQESHLRDARCVS